MVATRIPALVCAAGLLAACGGQASFATHGASAADSSSPRIALHPGSTPFRLSDAFGAAHAPAPELHPVAARLAQAAEPAFSLLSAPPADAIRPEAATQSASVRAATAHPHTAAVVATVARSAEKSSGSRLASALAELLIPVLGVDGGDLRDSFHAPRVGHRHDGIDIVAPRGTPVLAAADGTVLVEKWDRGGGRTLRLMDSTGRFLFYYAHLDGYAPGVSEGDLVRKGQVIAYVGRTGDVHGSAHLHLRIGKLENPAHWWKSTALDPYPILKRATPAADACSAEASCPQAEDTTLRAVEDSTGPRN